MAFSGVRYAVDHKTTRQYAITFTHDEITSVLVASEDPSERQAPVGTIHCIDDTPGEDGRHTVYQLTFSGGRVSCELGSTGKGLPAHHADGAYLARNSYAANVNNPLLDQTRTQPQPSQQKQPQLRVLRPQTTGRENPFNEVARSGDGDTTTKRKPGRRGPPAMGNLNVMDSTLESMFQQFGDDLTERAALGRIDPIIGRKNERDLIKQYLGRKKKSNVAVIGEAGTGKTAMFSALAVDIMNGDVPEYLKGARVIELNLGKMIAGTKFRGEFEKRLMPILDGLKERGGYFRGQKVILCFDEMHASLATGGSTEGANSVGDMLKPFLSAGDFTCMATTTLDEYKKHIESDTGLNRRFQPLMLEPPSKEETREILMGLKETYEEFHGLETPVTDEQIGYVIEMTSRFMPSKYNPDKSIGILDAAMSIAESEKRTALERKDIIRAVAAESKLSEDFLDQSDYERFENLRTELPNRVWGQDDALKAVTDRLVASRMGLNDPNQPWGVFLFQGPTGVGKTETAKVIDELLMSGTGSLIKIDMADYSDKHAASRLFGAPPGFVGFEDTKPILTEAVRDNPYSVILLDEVEKADPEIYNKFLSIFNDGEVTDNKGRKVDFRNTIVIMTTNLGANEVQTALEGKSFDFGGADAKKKDINSADMKKNLDEIYTKARNKFFRPEFIGRINALGGTVTFEPLDKDNVASKILAKAVKEVGDRLRNNPAGIQLKDVTLKIDDSVMDALLDIGYDPKYGARPIKAAVAEKMTTPLALWLMENRKDLTEATELCITKINPNAKNDNERITIKKRVLKAPALPKAPTAP